MLPDPRTIACLAAATCAGLLAACSSTPEDGPTAAAVRGEEMATQMCSTCHAVGRSGDSPHPDAVLFRDISRQYDVGALEEALAEGIAVGHPDMPGFELDPDEIDALLQYIGSIQSDT